MKKQATGMSPLNATLIGLAFAGAIHLGFAYDIEGARNLAIFTVWAIALPTTILCLTDTATKQLAATPDTANPLKHLLRLLCWVNLGTLIWFGAIWTGIAYGLTMMLGMIIRHQVKMQRDANAGFEQTKVVIKALMEANPQGITTSQIQTTLGLLSQRDARDIAMKLGLESHFTRYGLDGAQIVWRDQA
jgi:hypothetical protein